MDRDIVRKGSIATRYRDPTARIIVAVEGSDKGNILSKAAIWFHQLDSNPAVARQRFAHQGRLAGFTPWVREDRSRSE